MKVTGNKPHQPNTRPLVETAANKDVANDQASEFLAIMLGIANQTINPDESAESNDSGSPDTEEDNEKSPSAVVSNAPVATAVPDISTLLTTKETAISLPSNIDVMSKQAPIDLPAPVTPINQPSAQLKQPTMTMPKSIKKMDLPSKSDFLEKNQKSDTTSSDTFTIMSETHKEHAKTTIMGAPTETPAASAPTLPTPSAHQPLQPIVKALEQPLMALGNEINLALIKNTTLNQTDITSHSLTGSTQSIGKLPEDYSLEVEFLPQLSKDALKDIQVAHIKIYPPELGPIVAKIDIKKNGISLDILANNTKVKEMIESHLSDLQKHFMQSALPIQHINIRLDNTTLEGSIDSNGRQNKQQPLLEEKRDETMRDDQNNNKGNKWRQKINALVDTFV